MRLIDADDLIKAFEALDLMNGQYAESFSNMAGNRSIEIESAINYIENAKTIDAKPERKNGKWHDHQEGDWIYAKCSLCGAVQDSRSNFCPNCGAKMKAGK